MNYKLIQTDPVDLPVRDRCRIAEVSPSAYYAWEKHSGGQNPDDDLLKQIHLVLEEFAGYGYRRVTKELQRRGLRVNKKRVQRVMKAHGLGRRQKRRFVRTTDSRHGLRVYPNLIRGLVIDRPNQVWAADITYILMRRDFVYLFAVVDWVSRRVLSCRLSN